MLLASSVIQAIEAYFLSALTLTLRRLHSMQPWRDLVCVLLLPFGRVSTAVGVGSMSELTVLF